MTSCCNRVAYTKSSIGNSLRPRRNDLVAARTGSTPGGDPQLHCRFLCRGDEAKSHVRRDACSSGCMFIGRHHVAGDALSEGLVSSCAMGKRRIAIEPPSLGPISNEPCKSAETSR